MMNGSDKRQQCVWWGHLDFIACIAFTAWADAARANGETWLKRLCFALSAFFGVSWILWMSGVPDLESVQNWEIWK